MIGSNVMIERINESPSMTKTLNLSLYKPIKVEHLEIPSKIVPVRSVITEMVCEKNSIASRFESYLFLNTNLAN